jgi:hypothetical protein
MAAQQASGPIICPACGADSPAGRQFCWVCHAALERSSEDSNRAAARAAPIDGHRFRLGTVMLGIVLLAIFLGLVRDWPALAIFVSLTFILAVASTRAILLDRQLAGVRPSPHQKTILFVRSLTVVLGWILLCAIVIWMVLVGLVILFKEACGRVFGL